MKSRSEYVAMREQFRPNHLKLIFIAESPPESGQYLYDTGGSTTEMLFSALMKAIEIGPANKISGLQEIQLRGLFLIDATYHPVNDLKKAVRDQVITNDYAHLVRELLQTPDVQHVPIVLIKANVCKLLEPLLMKDGFNVINDGDLVYFPSHGHQQEFQEQLATILERHAIEIV